LILFIRDLAGRKMFLYKSTNSLAFPQEREKKKCSTSHLTQGVFLNKAR